MHLLLLQLLQHPVVVHTLTMVSHTCSNSNPFKACYEPVKLTKASSGQYTLGLIAAAVVFIGGTGLVGKAKASSRTRSRGNR